MGSLSRITRAGVLAMLLAGLTVGCSGGGGVVRVYFSINGDSGCAALGVSVDLAAADAVLATQADGTVDCVLDNLLTTNGCVAEFKQLDGGRTLQVIVSDCQIAPVSALFQCGFRSVDVAKVAAVTNANCSCHAQGCDSRPPVCVSEDSGPDACEDCANGRDDDDNGLADCDDPVCLHSPWCGEESTTSSTTSATYSTHTTSSTTTTTTLHADTRCRVIFRLVDPVTVGAIQWNTGYDRAPGHFVGSGDRTECLGMAPDSISAFSDLGPTLGLRASMIALAGISGPRPLAECLFQATAVPLPSDFDITVQDAADPNSQEQVPYPRIEVNVDCSGQATTTTTLKGATTTRPDGTTTTTVGETTTTTILEGTEVGVLLTLTSSTAPLGALQISLDYSAAAGGFQGSGPLVECSNLAQDAFLSVNDHERDSRLLLGAITLNGFVAPLDIARCTFVGTDPSNPPVAEDFVLTVTDSSDTRSNPVAATVAVTVESAP